MFSSFLSVLTEKWKITVTYSIFILIYIYIHTITNRYLAIYLFYWDMKIVISHVPPKNEQ